GAPAGPQRQPAGTALRARSPAGAGGAHPGAVRPGRHAAHRRRKGAGAAAPAGPELSAAAGDRRPSQLLAPYLFSGSQGIARPLSPARLAGRSAVGRAGAPAAPVTCQTILRNGAGGSTRRTVW